MMLLRGPDRNYSLKITLQMVKETEAAYGSLYGLAGEMVAKTLPLSTMVGVLKTVYRQAGCQVDEDVLDDFLLRQPCADILSSFLLDVLVPLEEMGGVTPGEDRTARKKGSV